MLKTNVAVQGKGQEVNVSAADLDAFVDAFFADGVVAAKAPAKVQQEQPKKTYGQQVVEKAKEKAKQVGTPQEFRLPNGERVRGYNAVFGGNGELLELDGKKMTMTAEERKKAKRGGKGGGARKDEGRDFVTQLAIEALGTTLAKAKLEATADFKHSKEGHVYRCEEADYGIRVSKSKEAKFDVSEEGFEAEVSYATRGKAKHRGGTIAKLLVTHINKCEAKDALVIADVKASGVVVHFAGAEYTIKIAKKRERCGFEGERADAF